jgi:membrane protease YdiL (CAAX protease family)
MRSSRRTALALIATVMVVTFAVVVFWLVHSSRNPAETATVDAAYLAAVGIAITLLMPLGLWWWKGRGGAAVHVSTQKQVADAADWLAGAMVARWRLEATSRRIVTPAPVTVWWRWAADEITVNGPAP